MPNPGTEFVTLPKEGFVRLPQVLQMFPIGKSKLWEMVKNKTFPQPVKLGPRTTVWDVAELRAFKDSLTPGGKSENYL